MTAPVEPTDPSNLFSPFLPSSYTVPEDLPGLTDFLVDELNSFSDVINDKRIGTLLQAAESFSGESFYYDNPKRAFRTGYQALARIPSFPNAGVLTITRQTIPQYPMPNVTPQLIISNLWGVASKPCTITEGTGPDAGDYFSFMNRGDPRITFDMNNTTITITTTIDMTAYQGFIFVSYIRDGI